MNVLYKTYKNIKLFTSQLVLLIRALWYSLGSTTRGLPGLKFDLYGRLIGLKYIAKYMKFCPLLVNPVSSVRYFEFNFVSKSLPFKKGMNVLDVSSPWLFGMWAVKKYEIDYVYVNPDEREFSVIRGFLNIVNTKGSYVFSAQDATELPYPDCIFDAIVSISVIEHISGNGDSKAVAEMWRILKPGGRIILTFPVMHTYEEEYRNDNVYSLPDVVQKDNSYFFQRFYDETAIKERLLAHLHGYVIEATELFGEIEKDFFRDYERRWISDGLKETIKDPWLMASNMKRYEHLNELTGLCVMGLLLQKVA